MRPISSTSIEKRLLLANCLRCYSKTNPSFPSSKYSTSCPQTDRYSHAALSRQDPGLQEYRLGVQRQLAQGCQVGEIEDYIPEPRIGEPPVYMGSSVSLLGTGSSST